MTKKNRSGQTSEKNTVITDATKSNMVVEKGLLAKYDPNGYRCRL